jgi:hypothetical protein
MTSFVRASVWLTHKGLKSSLGYQILESAEAPPTGPAIRIFWDAPAEESSASSSSKTSAGFGDSVRSSVRALLSWRI